MGHVKKHNHAIDLHYELYFCYLVLLKYQSPQSLSNLAFYLEECFAFLNHDEGLAWNVRVVKTATFGRKSSKSPGTVMNNCI